ncbi:glycoside hydrolase family 3 protein [Granulicella sp. 5B5]|uniref:glycoside hydrolase family 3 C-terminal domain-containing protein n=1 Tax=Granulicella sp. 5B5 TaxID=1617967 RepID=UPI0015F36D1F|nr:glycoside hydrolase family 3 C-terminal domain-containing protein [Granulicella sp. 5B5]QMV19406.1 glycoside hydrolase family 3 protein [Granulicella sp. 5B5]
MKVHPLLHSLLALSFSVSLLPAQTAKLPYQDPKLSAKERADDLVSRMTLEEKVKDLINTSAAVPRLGVPAYDWWNEGLHGVARSGYATMFPQAIGMAATWDTVEIGKIADVISTEARAKNNEALRHDVHSIYYGLTFWSPNINIFRDPRWGRGQETYGEDPFLTGKLGVAFVRGMQGTDPRYYKVIATPKHFAVHSGPESERHKFNVEPSAHDLWDTYMPAFRATIVDGQAGSIMCAYNAVDGVPACANKMLLEQIVRKDWGFEGYVTSDCGAIDDFYEKTAHRYSKDVDSAAVAGIEAGTDTNCGKSYLALTDAVKKGLVPESALDISLERLFTARFKLGLFDPKSMVPYDAIPFSEVASAAHHALALDAAEKAIVLLKNEDDTLPLRAGVKTVAVIGPNAASLSAIEGNYNAVPKNYAFPVDALTKAMPGTRVQYAQGSPYADGVVLPVPRTMFHVHGAAGEEGLKAEYFAGDVTDGKPVLTRVDKEIDFDWNSASPVAGVPADHFAVRWTGTISAPQRGTYDFSMRLAHCYPCGDRERFEVFLDGKQVAGFASADDAEYRGSDTPRFQLTFADTKPHALRVEYRHHAPLFGAGITMEWEPKPSVLLGGAVEAAKKADVVVAFVGLSPELEGEEMPIKVDGFAGGDRTSIKLPTAQQEMLEVVAATGKPLVVVLMNGSALAVNWTQEHAKAVVEAWYPGEAGGEAIADTLLGRNDPGGRLPITFYASDDQLPPFTDYSMKGRTYRYFKGKPLYGFGYGLSYTSFAYSNLHLSTSTLQAGDDLTVEADVKNTGKRAGDEVAEVYLTPPQTDVSPTLELAGFQRVHLLPGETKHLTFALDPRTLSQVDDKGVRAVDAGSYTLTVGGAQPVAGNGETRRYPATETVSTTFNIQGRREMPR